MSALERLLAGSHGWRIADPVLLASLLGLVLVTAAVGFAGVARKRALLRRSFGELSAVVAPVRRVRSRWSSRSCRPRRRLSRSTAS